MLQFCVFVTSKCRSWHPCPEHCLVNKVWRLTVYPTGSFTAYAARFISPSYAFALGWNYWLNDAVSLAGDLVAAQLVVRYWLDVPETVTVMDGGWKVWASDHAWILSAVLWAVLVGVNAVHVRAYGEMGKPLVAV
jgi:AAT family amino acid transporter